MATNRTESTPLSSFRASNAPEKVLDKRAASPASLRVTDLRLQEVEEIEVAHLTSWPPFFEGSFTKTIDNVLHRTPGHRHIAISYWEGSPPNGASCRDVILTSRHDLPLWRRASLWLPSRLRARWFCGVGGRSALAYTWQAIKALRVLKPKILVCYDAPWQGRLLRRYIDWPCRIILSQRGLSYFMISDMAAQTYSLQSFDAVWCLTNASYRYDRQRMSYYEPMVQVLPNPVDARRYAPVSPEQKRRLQDKWNLPADRQIVLFLSALRPKKGAHMLLSSWADILKEVPKAFLWIVGGGDPAYKRYLRDMTRAMAISDSVKFQGQVAPGETASCFQAADLFVFPTLFVEGQSLSLLEAMSSGLACVASEHRVAREAYSDDEVMFVPDPNLNGAFVEPVVKLLQDVDFRGRMGERARAHVLKYNDYDVVLPLLEDAISRELQLVNGLCNDPSIS